MSSSTKDILEDCKKLISASKELGLQRIARISSIPVEAVELVADALEKKTPEPPHLWGEGYSGGEIVYDMYDCPNCGKSYELECEKYDCCPNCGQAIKWEDEEDAEID
jgi:hypothetical protein